MVAYNVVVLLKRLERHIPGLAIASAINERLTDLLMGARATEMNWHSHNIRMLMHSEVVRRHTFEKWPHMDYKWALPDQMAQAGFYHQPSASGEDRAMCFTCNVCLVCWEKTDEPWSEHERHSPICPFVKGEYTQNVPLAVTYATNPALKYPNNLHGFDVISNSDYANVLCTSCTLTGDITIWSIERQLKQMLCFNIATLMKDIFVHHNNGSSKDLESDFENIDYEWVRVTSICVLPNLKAKKKISSSINGIQTTSGGGGRGGGVGVTSTTTNKTQTTSSSLRAGVIGTKILLGLSILHTSGEHLLRIAVLNVLPSDRHQLNQETTEIQQNCEQFNAELQSNAAATTTGASSISKGTTTTNSNASSLGTGN